MRVINILDNGTNINYGVWISAISTIRILKERYGVESQIWYPQTDHPLQKEGIHTLGVADTSLKVLKKYIKELELSPRDTIIQTHGSWRFPSRWGNFFHQMGFNWIYHPHGMLNKHGFAQKSWKKIFYWYLKEQFFLKNADAVRLVSQPEKEDLIELVPHTKSQLMVIPNGIELVDHTLSKPNTHKRYVLFMSRLFHGKGVVPMVKGWLNSILNNNSDYELIIAGPDQGELEKMNTLLEEKRTSNISYIGPIYGETKKGWLQKASFFILPSFSEAFSTSILEAMSHGAIPIITPNCNFPEVFEQQLGYEITTDPKDIEVIFNQLVGLPEQEIKIKQQKGAKFIAENYTLDKIAVKQFQIFEEMLNRKILN